MQLLCQSLATPVETALDQRQAYLIYEKIRFPVRISASAELPPSLMSAPLERVIEIPATKMGGT
jgi:hypothetical protein